MVFYILCKGKCRKLLEVGIYHRVLWTICDIRICWNRCDIYNSMAVQKCFPNLQYLNNYRSILQYNAIIMMCGYIKISYSNLSKFESILNEKWPFIMCISLRQLKQYLKWIIHSKIHLQKESSTKVWSIFWSHHRRCP